MGAIQHSTKWADKVTDKVQASRSTLHAPHGNAPRAEEKIDGRNNGKQPPQYMPKLKLGTPLLLLLALLFICPSVVSAASSNPEIDVILWFDTEDYLLPADDDAC